MTLFDSMHSESIHYPVDFVGLFVFRDVRRSVCVPEFHYPSVCLGDEERWNGDKGQESRKRL